MKKYNLSDIMRRAWRLVKEVGMSISSGLKKAWREAKNMCKELPELIGSPKQIAWAEDIRKKMIEYGNSCINFHESKGRKKMPERMKKAMETPEHKKLVEDMGLTLRYMNPEEYKKFWDEYEELVKRLLPLTKE